MELRRAICEDLKLPWHYVAACDENRAIILVHDNWIKSFVQTKSLPTEFSRHSNLSNEEIGLLLQQMQGSVDKPWRKLEICKIDKKATLARKLSRIQKVDSRNSDLTYYQLLHYVSETNYMNRWRDTLKANQKKNKRSNMADKYDTYNDVVREALQRLHNCPIIDICEKNKVFNTASPNQRLETMGLKCHPNVLSAIGIFESNSRFYILYPYFKYTLSDCVRFSPAIFANSTVKPLFIIYQLLQATRHFHDNGMCLGDINIADIRVDANLWIQVESKILQGIVEEEPLTKTNVQEKLEASNQHAVSNQDCKRIATISENKWIIQSNERSGHLSCERFYNLPILDLVGMWARGEMSNFDYLMALNYLACRRMGNPNYHPVLPWVMDFTVANGGWRDLSKSKFRLNKGDRQLELTYETLPFITSSQSNFVSGEPIHVPHHVSDVLSEITYYVYKARQTPRSVLCQFVRSNWVPAEYPSNMQRMFEWTPDECIPEFFYDAAIFRSIHRDLPDLEIPWWASSPEDFVTRHRDALESHHVTERLHHWIDLTFGYKLSGSAAVKAKNVCYHLVDQHTNLTVGGVVQLFTHPHPHHSSFSLILSRRPTCLQHWKPSKKVTFETLQENITANQSTTLLKEFVDEELVEKKRSFHRSKICVESKNSDHQTIILPKDYIPLARLNHLESVFTFGLKAALQIPESQQLENCEVSNPYHQRHIRDMVVVGCLIVELFLASKFKTIRLTASLEERYQFICSVLFTDTFELPRCVKRCVLLLLQLKKVDQLNKLEIPRKLPVITEDGLPPPSAHQLLQPLIHIIPFPSYFQNMYQFLCHLKMDMICLETDYLYTDSSTHGSSENSKRAEKMVKMMLSKLQTLFHQLNDDGRNLIMPYIKEVFVSPHSTVMASWYLFGVVSKSIGPRQTLQMLVKPIVRLFDVEYPTSKHMKLFHRSYLLQLIVRLGLQTFLSCFSTLLIEAVGGIKDFSVKIGSYLRSSEFEELNWEGQNKDVGDFTFSPFEDTTSHQDVSSPYDNKSDCEDLSATAAAEDQIGAEPEIFVFDSEDFNGSLSERVEGDTTDCGELLDHKFAETSSNSTNGDVLLINEMTSDSQINVAHLSQSSVDAEDGSLKDTSQKLFVNRPRSSCSFSEGFPGTTSKPKKLMDSEIYSTSVPNIASLKHSFSNSSAPPDELSELPLEACGKPVKSDSEYNISDVATETVIWLSHRLGPVLTAKYLSRNLLRMLSLCYLGNEQLEWCSEEQETTSFHTVSPREVVGDRSSRKVLKCLVNIASLYGEQFVLLQYFPHMTEIVIQAKKRVTSGCEAGLIGNLVFIRNVVPYISDATLMDHLQDTLIKEIMYPTIRLISSPRLSFPSGGHARQIIAYKFLDALCIIGLRIGFEMTRKHLTRIIHQFFAIFSKVHSKNEKEIGGDGKDQLLAKNVVRSASVESMSPPLSDNDYQNQEAIINEELTQAFTPELAYIGYILFCKLAGGIYADQHLPNDELIYQLCLKYDKALVSWNLNSDKKMNDLCSAYLHEREIDREDKSEVTLVGNRIDIKVNDEEENSLSLPPNTNVGDGLKKLFNFSKYDLTSLVSKQMDNDSRHLKGNWLAYWEHEIGRNEKDHRFNFKQIKLQTFVGHTNSVRTLYVLDNENSFISASKDKTVKLWSLRSHGDGSALSNCQWTYNNHKKSVFSVTFIDSMRLAASCDSTVHIWDPFMGSCLKAFEKNSPATVLLAMPPPSTVLITATTEASIRFLDVRTLKYMHEFKVSLGPAGLIRCLAVSPNSHWIAVGYSSGIISILDVRTGLLNSTWKGHEGEILQVKAYNDQSFVTSSLDQCVSVWNADDGKLKCHLRGPTEPVHCLSFYKNEMISGTTANRIGVHTSIDSEASFSSTRLQSDTFKGVLTSMAILPQNRVLLLGADNGYIRLLC